MRELWVIGGIVGLAVIAAITFTFFVIAADDESPPAEISATATAAVLPAISRPIASPTTNATPPAAAYEPIAWDARQDVQRLPPPTEAAALEEREVHRNGFAFGAEPSAFAGVAGGEGCGELVPGEALRAGDWVVEVESVTAGAQLVLTPRAAEFDREEVWGSVPWLLRWTQLDGDRERTHVHEQFWGGRERTFETPLVLPDGGTWRAIATHGPNWGCFVFAVDGGVAIPWMMSGSVQSATTTSPERIARFEESMVQVGGFGTPARRCVTAEGLRWARSGEFMTRVDQIVERWSPTRRGSKVAWTPLNDQDLGELIVMGASSDALWSTYSYREPGPVRIQSVAADGEQLDEFAFITSITPPQAGEWRLVGSAEPGNWGCFEVTVGG